MQRKRLSQALSKRIIDDLGGSSSTAKLLQTHQPTVSKWKKIGFPLVYVTILQERFGYLKSVQESHLQENYIENK